MLTTNWQADVVIYEIFLFMPVYFVILVAIGLIRKKKSAFRTHYYTLVLSQGAADFLTVILFITQMLPRYFQIGNSLVWSLDAYGAATLYVNSGPQMFILRSVGVFLITMQRYVSICRQQGTLYHMFHVTPAYALILTHWLVSFALHTPAVLICHAHFENAQSFFVISSEDHKRTSAAIVISTFLFCGFSTLYMYFCILRVLCSAKRTAIMTVSAMQTRSSRYQEARLCIHVFFLASMSAVTFAYYVFQAIYSNELGVGDAVISTDSSDPLQQDGLRALRLWYPLVSGNLSFINPVLLLLLNRDVKLIFLGFCRTGTRIDRTSSIIQMNRTL